MIFPKDISKTVSTSNKGALTYHKNKIAIVVGVVVISIGYIIVNRVASGLGGVGILIKIVYTIIVLVVGFYLFNNFIFKIADKREEYTKQNSDSFGRFISIKEPNDIPKSYMGYNLNLFDYKGNDSFFVLRFRFGNNNSMLRKSTNKFLESAINTILSRGLKYKIVVDSEDFTTSEEYRTHAEMINRIKNKDIQEVNRSIFLHMLKEIEATSNVEVIYIIVSSKGAYFRTALEDCAREIINNYTSKKSAFRVMEVLDFKDLINFYTTFYRLGTIDLSALKLKENLNSEAVNRTSVLEFFGALSTSGYEYFDPSIDLKKLDKERTIK